MAKRYARLNWQNKPSVATPVSAANLNVMDKGLDDLDLFKIDTDAIVNNGVTTVAGTVLDGRMGKTLQDQVTTINNNLTDKSQNVLPELLRARDEVAGKDFDDFTALGSYYISNLSGYMNSPIVAGSAMLIIFGVNARFGQLMMASDGNMYARLNTGAFGGWRKFTGTII